MCWGRLAIPIRGISGHFRWNITTARQKRPLALQTASTTTTMPSSMQSTVILIGVLFVFAHARTPDSVDFNIKGGDTTQNPFAQWQKLPATCGSNDVAARGDDDPRWNGWPTTSTTKWGPDQYDYATVTSSQVPASCSATAWAWNRIIAAINYTIAMDVNYCHHHSPWYDTPAAFKTNCGLSNSKRECSCSVAPAGKRWPWRGMDCSNFSAFVYNLALGYYPTSSIGRQACADNAPGQLLSDITLSKLSQLAPGDLVFITVSKSRAGPAPQRVSHIVLWTGFTVDFTPGATGPFANATLIANLPSSQRSAVVRCQKAQLRDKLPVYVLADSTYTGPNFRPFCGWYYNSFSHARRIINPGSPVFNGTAITKNNASIAYYDAAGDNCMSYWALQG